MMRADLNSYKIPLTVAIGLHALLFIFLISSHTGESQLQITPVEPVDIIKAVSLDQAQVEIEIAKIATEKQQRQQAEQARQATAQAQLTNARKQREQEEQRFAALQDQTQTNEQNQLIVQQSAQEKLQTLQSQQQVEQQQLEKLQRQQQQEQGALAQVQAAREALEKRQLQEQQQAQAALAQLQEQRQELAEQLQAEREALEKRQLQEQQRQQRITETQVDHYKNLIVHAISRNWIIPPNLEANLSCQFEIQLARDGAVEAVRLIRSSGDPILDRSAETAIYRSSPLPVPSDSEAFTSFQVLNLTVRPEAMLS